MASHLDEFDLRPGTLGLGWRRKMAFAGKVGSSGCSDYWDRAGCSLPCMVEEHRRTSAGVDAV
jgi:hypothetical protein